MQTLKLSPLERRAHPFFRAHLILLSAIHLQVWWAGFLVGSQWRGERGPPWVPADSEEGERKTQNTGLEKPSSLGLWRSTQHTEPPGSLVKTQTRSVRSRHPAWPGPQHTSLAHLLGSVVTWKGCLRKQGFTQWMLCFWWPELCFYYIYIHISYLGYSLGVFKATWMRDLEFAKWKLGKKTHT